MKITKAGTANFKDGNLLLDGWEFDCENDFFDEKAAIMAACHYMATVACAGGVDVKNMQYPNEKDVDYKAAGYGFVMEGRTAVVVKKSVDCKIGNSTHLSGDIDAYAAMGMIFPVTDSPKPE